VKKHMGLSSFSPNSTYPCLETSFPTSIRYQTTKEPADAKGQPNHINYIVNSTLGILVDHNFLFLLRTYADN
jgi:hypothetical protein